MILSIDKGYIGNSSGNYYLQTDGGADGGTGTRVDVYLYGISIS